MEARVIARGKLFMGLMTVIILISISNAVRYLRDGSPRRLQKQG